MTSAGLLMFRRSAGANAPRIDVFLIHPGGPFFRNKDDGYWGIPKGMAEQGEELLETAIREFREEVGISANGPYIRLGRIRQKSGKIVHAWAFETTPDRVVTVRSNLYQMEWPRGSGRLVTVPEADAGRFFDIATARRKINAAQAEFLDRLLAHLAGNGRRSVTGADELR